MIGFGNNHAAKPQKSNKVTESLDCKDESAITKLTDSRLVMIDTSSDDFFKRVTEFKSQNNQVQQFVMAMCTVQMSKIPPFWVPIFEPSIDRNYRDKEGKKGKIVFKPDQPQLDNCHSYKWWHNCAERMEDVDGKKWKLGTEMQYYAFLNWLINQLKKNGWTLNEAIEAVVLRPSKLSIFPKTFKEEKLRQTGANEICGVYDLANNYKILSASNGNEKACWIAGACPNERKPLADLYYTKRVGESQYYTVGWLILT